MAKADKTFAHVQSAIRRGFNVVPLIREIAADTITPVAAYLRLTRDAAPSFLLESVEGGERMARYSFLGSHPFETLVVRNGVARVRDERGKESILPGPPLAALDARLKQYQAYAEPGLPRFCGGAVGFLSYELSRSIEPATRLRPTDEDEARLMMFSRVIAFDHVRHRMLLIANVIDQGRISQARAYRDACSALDEMQARLSRPSRDEIPRKHRRIAELVPKTSLTAAEFLAGVRRIKHHIREGDIFQGVLSQRFELPLKAKPFAVYRALRSLNPSPYMFCIDMGDQAAVGASPEMLVRVEDRAVETRPIAGTRPRGRTEDEDRRYEARLLASVKERAEHLMLVDLGRNDVGRIAVPGSVKVRSLMQVERYSHVMHLVSSVTGRLKRNRSSWDALAACFPAGTVTGAPKIRAMQILSEIEPTPRGLYAGAVVYVDFRGNLDSAIAIRSMLIRNGKAYVQAGAGIVADSSPRKELEEVRNKARAMLSAIAQAESTK